MKNVITTVRNNFPVLFYVNVYLAALTAICLMGMFIDDRTLTGLNVWIKPFKFAISTLIYAMTVGYLTTLYPFSRLKSKIIIGTVAWSLLIEMIIIPLQAFRGVQSHYNMSSALDGIMFGAMGVFIGINVAIMGFFLIETLRLKMKVPASLQWAIALGWIIVIGGSWVGGQMISQMSHTVGAADGGAGLPILNWSTIAGDLRIAHFFGLHGIQVVPLFAYFLSQKWQTTERNKILATVGFGLIYASWIAYTFYQAKQAIPLLALS